VRGEAIGSVAAGGVVLRRDGDCRGVVWRYVA
jgi:hypothetical protein